MTDKIVSLFGDLTDEELEGLLSIASTIYKESPVNINVKEGTINVERGD